MVALRRLDCIFIRLLVYHTVTVNVKSLSVHLRDFIYQSLMINLKSISEPSTLLDRYFCSLSLSVGVHVHGCGMRLANAACL